MSSSPLTSGRRCAQCALRFSRRRDLRRHVAFDHRPAPDGAWLVAQLTTSPAGER